MKQIINLAMTSNLVQAVPTATLGDIRRVKAKCTTAHFDVGIDAALANSVLVGSNRIMDLGFVDISMLYFRNYSTATIEIIID